MDPILWAAQQAFGAYKSAVGSTSPVTEQKIPDWEQLPDRVKNGWVEAAKAIMVFAEMNNSRVVPNGGKPVEWQNEAPFLYG